MSNSSKKNSILKPALFQSIAQQVGLQPLDAESIDLLSIRMESEIKQIVENARKYCHQSHRQYLLTSDINDSLKLYNIELKNKEKGLYGYHSNDPMTFRTTSSSDDLFFVEDTVIPLQSDPLNISNNPIPSLSSLSSSQLPSSPSLSIHWLSIEGEIPSVPENEFPSSESSTPLSLPLSREQSLLFSQIEESIFGDNLQLRQKVLKSISLHTGLQPLLFYFILFIQHQIPRNLNSLSILSHLLQLCSSLFSNPSLILDQHLNYLLPSILTCSLCDQLGPTGNQYHYKIREQASQLISQISSRYESLFSSLNSRITSVCFEALSASHPFSSQYGALQILYGLDIHVIRLMILPHVSTLHPTYQQTLASLSKKDYPLLSHPLLYCQAILLSCVGRYIHWLTLESHSSPSEVLIEEEEKEEKEIDENQRVKRPKIEESSLNISPSLSSPSTHNQSSYDIFSYQPLSYLSSDDFFHLSSMTELYDCNNRIDCLSILLTHDIFSYLYTIPIK